MAVVVIAYLLVCALLYSLQDRIIFYPPPWSDLDNQAERDLAPRHVDLVAEDGASSFAWWFDGSPPPRLYSSEGLDLDRFFEEPGQARPPHPLTWLLLSGNAGSIAVCRFPVSGLLQKGQRALALAYRGYSGNAGAPSEEGMIADAVAAWTWLRRSEVPARDIVIVGKSLGGGIACGLLEQVLNMGEVPAALVLETTFTSLPDVAADRFPLFPCRWLLRTKLDNRRRLAQACREAPDLPVVILGAEKDAIVPYAMSHELMEIAGPKALFLSAPVGHHRRLTASGRAIGHILHYLAERAGRKPTLR